MANALYDKGREAFGNAEIDWIDDDIIVVLVDTDDYTVNLATHQYLSSISSGARLAGGTLGTKVSLANKTNTGGIMDADNTTCPSVTGDEGEALVLCKRDTSTFENSLLIAYIDTFSAGAPYTPDGGDVIIYWADTTNKIFKL
jgi:hypothetical protein